MGLILCGAVSPMAFSLLQSPMAMGVGATRLLWGMNSRINIVL